MKKIRDLLRDITYLCIVKVYCIHNVKLRKICIVLADLILLPLLKVLGYLLYIPLVLRYGYEARIIDNIEQEEWSNKKAEEQKRKIESE